MGDKQKALSVASTSDSHVYYDKKDTNITDAKTKPKSRLNKFLSKFQSSAVKSAALMDKKAKEEEERTGVKRQANAADEQAVWEVQAVGRHQYVL